MVGGLAVLAVLGWETPGVAVDNSLIGWNGGDSVGRRETNRSG